MRIEHNDHLFSVAKKLRNKIPERNDRLLNP